MADDPKPLDKTKPPPLFMRAGETPGWQDVVIKRSGTVFRDAIDVDVLGCYATRWQRTEYGAFILDDDGVACVEKIYGFYTIEWKPDDEPEHIGYGYVAPFF
jgi:hypothetical protein